MRLYSPAKLEVSCCFPTVVTKLKLWVPYFTRMEKFPLSQPPEMDGRTAKHTHPTLLLEAPAC